MAGKGQKRIHRKSVGRMVKVKAYTRFCALLIGLPIVQAEEKCGQK